MLKSNLGSNSIGNPSNLRNKNTNRVKACPRPKSRLASYLGACRKAEKLESASLDWSTLTVMSENYAPRPHLVSNNIFQHILSNPMQDLPAQYNSSVLHILEDYRRLTIDNRDLSERLHAEIEAHREDNERFQRDLQSYVLAQNVTGDTPVETNSLPKHDHLRDYLSRLSRDSGQHSNEHDPKFIFNESKGGKIRESADAMLRKNIGYRLQRRTSPSRAMTLTGRAILAADAEQESGLPLSDRATSTGSYTTISVDNCPGSKGQAVGDVVGDGLPHPQLAQLYTLVERISRRLNWAPNDLCDDITEAYFEVCVKARSDAVNARESVAKGHQRSFSFLPGDDTRGPSSSQAHGGFKDSHLLRVRASPRDDMDTIQGSIPKASSEESRGAARSGTLYRCRHDEPDIEHNSCVAVHCENSARSVSTVTKDNSYRKSSSPLESLKIDHVTTQALARQRETMSFAVTAARIAGSRDNLERKAENDRSSQRSQTRTLTRTTT